MGFDTGDRVKVVNYFCDEDTSPCGQVGYIVGRNLDYWEVALPEFEYPEGVIFTDFAPLLLHDNELELVETPVEAA